MTGGYGLRIAAVLVLGLGLLTIGAALKHAPARSQIIVGPQPASETPATVDTTARAKRANGYRATCSDLPQGGREMSVASPDGAQIYAIRFGTGRAGIVLAPQGDSSICSWAHTVSPIVQAGIQVLIFEPGTYAARYSSRAADPDGAHWEQEIAAVTEAFRKTGVETIFLGGSSFGAGAALDAIPLLEEKPRGVVFMAGTGGATGLATVMAEKEVSFLFITSQFDAYVSESTRYLFDHAASGDATFVLYPKSAIHGVALFDSSVGEHIRSTIVDWLVERS